MSIAIRPDPDHPLGGHALIVVRDHTVEGPVSVSVMDLFEDRHLGQKGWQSAPAALGPYAAHDKDGALVVPVGPEMVDHIEEFATLRLTVAGVTAELAWPETIRTSPSKAGLGGMGVLSGMAPYKPTPKKQKTPESEKHEPPEKTEPAPPEEVEEDNVVIVDPEPKPPVSRLPLILAALALLAAVGGGLWWWRQQEAPAPVQETVAQPPQEVAPPVAAAGCDAAGLAAAAALPPAEGFAVVADCGAEGDPEARFRIIEAAAEADVGAAITMIGRWYDPAEAAAVGSNFATRDPAQAARYYSKAAAAGYADAAALLQRACGALDPDADPTHEMARDSYCARP